MKRLAAEPTCLAVHRYADGKVLAIEEDFHIKMREKYGAPFVELHRGDLQKMLYERAVELGVCVRLGARVVQVSLESCQVLLESNEKLTADLIVGADGLWSRCREALLGQKDQPLPTSDLAYRIVLTLDQISNPELREWVSKPDVHFWVGPGAHAVGYSLRAGTIYNIVLLCPDDLPRDVSRQAGSVDEMRKLFVNWDPILARFLDHVDSVDKWKLMHRSELDSWTNDKKNFVLIGDACHPMLPYLAQGANSSLEDGAVLGRLLGGIRSKAQLAQAIQLYEELRKVRSEAFHMPDGPEQVKRDEVFASQLGKAVGCKFPSRWTCPEVQPWLYGYNAHKEADAALRAQPFVPNFATHQQVPGRSPVLWLWHLLPMFRRLAYDMLL